MEFFTPPGGPVPAHTSSDEITALMQEAARGDRAALDALFEAVYHELKVMAQWQRGRWDGDYTLNTTALIHETYVKLVRQDKVQWNDRAHFFRVAGKAMRHILVNYSERRQASKRGGGSAAVTLDEANPVAPEIAEEIIALNRALERLGQIGERPVLVVECRFFAGLSVEETAEVLGISPATVKRDWATASAWLRRDMGRTE